MTDPQQAKPVAEPSEDDVRLAREWLRKLETGEVYYDMLISDDDPPREVEARAIATLLHSAYQRGRKAGMLEAAEIAELENYWIAEAIREAASK